MELKPKATESKPSKFEGMIDERLGELLEAGETVRGVAAASQQKGIFSGGVVALAVTDRRLIIQPLDRRGKGPKGEATSIAREEVASAKLGRPGGSWESPSSIIVGQVSIQVKLKTKSGDKFRFMLMDGSGLFGAMGGGESQAAGADALRVFLDRDRAADI